VRIFATNRSRCRKKENRSKADDLRDACLSLFAGAAAGAVETFEQTTLRLWEKHGIRPTIFTTLVANRQELT